MKRKGIILALGFSPLLIVFGVIRITHNPITDAMLALIGCTALSWALLTMFDVISSMFAMLDDAQTELKQKEEEIAEMASTQLTIAVLAKIQELQKSIEKEEG